VRGFLNGRPSSIDNVLLIAEAIGYTLAELDRPPDEFRQAEGSRDATSGAAMGASLLAFEESPTAMAIVLLDGTIVKVNGKMRRLLGYDDGDLIGASAATFSASGEEALAERRDELAATDAAHARVSKLRRKDGTLVSAVTSALVVRDDDGQPRYVIARASPVSEASG
jgi:PAS domain S-box-containing protein